LEPVPNILPINWLRIGKFSVADPGCFIPDPDPTFFSCRIQKLFHPGSRILHEKWNTNLLFLASYAFKSKVLVLVIVKKIRNPGSGKKLIPDPDLGSMSKKHRIRIRNTWPDFTSRKRRVAAPHLI
jgi:hypothetical protein